MCGVRKNLHASDVWAVRLWTALRQSEYQGQSIWMNEMNTQYTYKLMNTHAFIQDV